jgi:phosphatidylinositol glycan class V
LPICCSTLFSHTVQAIRKKEVGLMVLAGDVEPLDVISHLPVLCEDFSVPYIFVRSKGLGNFCLHIYRFSFGSCRRGAGRGVVHQAAHELHPDQAQGRVPEGIRRSQGQHKANHLLDTFSEATESPSNDAQTKWSTFHIHFREIRVSMKGVAGRAVASRVAVVGLALLSARIFAPYDSSTQLWTDSSLAPLASWDGAHLVAVAERGYAHEHSYAFFPGFPLLVRLVLAATGMSGVTAAVVLSNVCFVLAALVLSRMSSPRAVTLFLLSPANVFLSAAYSESCFALFVFLGVWCLLHDKCWSATAAFFVAACVRSNGAVLALLLLARGHVLRAGLIGVPFVLQNAQCFIEFCFFEQQAWCEEAVPVCYSYVQSHYWSNGFLAYWKWSNVPNFLLALPMAVLIASIGAKTLREGLPALTKVRGQLNIVAVLLGVACLLTMNVQIMTRLLAVFPNVYAEAPRRHWVEAFFVAYSLLGIVLFPTFYPWT